MLPSGAIFSMAQLICWGKDYRSSSPAESPNTYGENSWVPTRNRRSPAKRAFFLPCSGRILAGFSFKGSLFRKEDKFEDRTCTDLTSNASRAISTPC